MMLLLSPADLDRLSDNARAEVLSLLSDGHAGASRHPDGPRNRTTRLARLDVDQARAYVADLSERTLAALRAMAAAPEEGFRMDDIARAIGATGPGELRTIWGGLRRRAATITGDPAAVLVRKTSGGPEAERRGQMHPDTRRAFRAIFGMEVEV